MRRRELSDGERADVWVRWKRGETQEAIARALGCARPPVTRWLHRTGGFEPVVRRRAARVLSRAEREEISRGVAAGASVRALARQLGRAPSTVSRELTRNGGRSVYRAEPADRAAWARACRPKPCWLAQHPRLPRRQQGYHHRYRRAGCDQRNI